jgi:hypothetical protein
MTNPIIVDTVENAFVPLLIVNNSARDAALLRKFREPAWNYQVIRFLDSTGNDIIPRKDKVWTTKALVPRMVQALEKAKQPVPQNLKLLAQEISTHTHARAAFSQHCFWTGEMRLGAIDGVIQTEAGWLDGREVTLVTYDKNALPLATLIKQATAARCADSVYVPSNQLQAAKNNTAKPVKTLTNNYRKAKESDQKRQIAGTKFTNLNLTPSQATKVNAFARVDTKKALSYLTKNQRDQL